MEDPLEDIHQRMRLANLEARRELLEIEREALNRRIVSRLTSPLERQAARNARDELMAQWAEIVRELIDLQRVA